MNIWVKFIIIILNLVVLILAGLWYLEVQEFEPAMAFIVQISALSILLFEKKLSKIGIEEISNSEIDISVAKDDDSQMDIRNVKDSSKIRIKRK